MNEQLQQALANVIEKATTGAEAATEFLVEQTPDVVYQLIMWYGVKYGLYFVLGLGLIFFGYKVWFKNDGTKTGRFAKEAYERGEEWTRFNGKSSGTVSSTEYDTAVSLPSNLLSKMMAVVLCIVGTCFINIQWLQILVAPKIWLIEYAATLVK